MTIMRTAFRRRIAGAFAACVLIGVAVGTVAPPTAGAAGPCTASGLAETASAAISLIFTRSLPFCAIRSRAAARIRSRRSLLRSWAGCLRAADRVVPFAWDAAGCSGAFCPAVTPSSRARATEGSVRMGRW